MVEHVGSITGESSVLSVVRRIAYPTVLLGSFFVLLWGVEGPYPLETVAIGLQISAIFTVLGLEFLIPFVPQWGDLRNVTRADVIYFLLAAPIDQLQIGLLVGLLASTAQFHHYLEVVNIWPAGTPMLVQLFLVTLVVDFFKYWYHRWTHEVPFLWRMHCIHHCVDRLQMMRASYFFPVDMFITVGIATLAMLMCGVDYQVIIFHNVWAGITGLLNHSNVDWECGFFDSFLNSPGHHRAHHAVDLWSSNQNFGSFFNFADRIFGTRYLPSNEKLRREPLGLSDDYDVPETFLAQLAVPFRWRQVCKQEPNATESGS